MKKLALATAILALAAPIVMAQTAPQISVWITDPAHSEVSFTIRRLEVTDVQGRFGRVTGELDINQADVTRSTMQMTIDLKALNTKDQDRDEHLRSEAFFEVAMFPTATFVSTSVAKNGRGLTIAGNLTLHGFTKPVTLQVDPPSAPKMGPDKKLHTRYRATTTISRDDFAVGNGYPEVAISDTANLVILLDTVKKQ